MTKKIIWFVLNCFFMISITSCDVEEVIPLEDTYSEYIVVQAELHPEQKFPGVRFTKTLPLGVSFDIKDAELKNVSAYLVKNGFQVIPLFYTSDGLYKPFYDFYVNEGEIYEIYAERDGTFIYGKTTIPYKPNITDVNYNVNGYYYEADVQPESDEVYGALWIVSGNPSITAEDYFSVNTPFSDPNNMIAVRTSSIPEEYRKPIYSGKRYIQVFSFDKSFRKYFYSRTSGQEINDPFIQGGGTVEWNMQGKNVIGMFVGVTPGEIINVN